jgi:hypothetical protein
MILKDLMRINLLYRSYVQVIVESTSQPISKANMQQYHDIETKSMTC